MPEIKFDSVMEISIVEITFLLDRLGYLFQCWDRILNMLIPEIGGPALMALWSYVMPLTASWLLPLRACPDGCVVLGNATDC